MLYMPIYQPEMQNAKYRQTVYPYRMPIRMWDEFFVRVSEVEPRVRDYFWISQYGNVYNERNGYLITPTINADGYIMVNLRLKEEYYHGNQKNIMLFVHRLVALVFIGPPPSPEMSTVNHKDCNRANPCYWNLEWTTQNNNILYSLNLGRYHDEDGVYRSSKYTKEEVEKVCELLQSGVTDYTELAARVFNSPPTPSIYALIQSIRTKDNWTNISSKYSIPDIDHRTFTSTHIIHSLCQYLENHPEEVHAPGKNAIEILQFMGFDVSHFSKKERLRYNNALYQIKTQKAYRKIISQYNIQF